ncbi:MAG: hypothetical protein ACPG66_06690, partial [Flavobacteriales bacterium]
MKTSKLLSKLALQGSLTGLHPEKLQFAQKKSSFSKTPILRRVQGVRKNLSLGCLVRDLASARPSGDSLATDLA